MLFSLIYWLLLVTIKFLYSPQNFFYFKQVWGKNYCARKCKKNGYREFDHSGNSGTFKSFQFPISALYSVSNHAGDRDNTTNSHRYSPCLSLGGGYKGIDIMNVLT